MVYQTKQAVGQTVSREKSNVALSESFMRYRDNMTYLRDPCQTFEEHAGQLIIQELLMYHA